MTTIDQAAQDIADCLHSDSNVPQKDSLPKIKAALEKDCAIPTKKEIELLVMGDDEGTIPRDLKKRFPALDKALNSFF